ncbi:MAG: hypothetical protein Q8O67_23890 [Deltaproteobacteria bacterium]|nr:hypothetical protein [Deltaproteobacteria bacterium]
MLASAGWGYVVVAFFAFAFGTALRLLGYFGDEMQLWLDEASWAQMLVEGRAAWIRPAGYMWLTARLLDVVNNEQMLRSLSVIAGIAQLPLVLVALRLSLGSKWLALFGVYLLAINPVAVAMSKEFKPYALEAAVHGALVIWALAYCRSDRRGHLIGLVVTAALSPLFAWSVVFAYPGVFAAVGLRALKQRRTGDAVIAGAGALCTLVVLASIWAMRVSGKDEKTDYWGRKYDVFYVGDSALEKLQWLTGKSADVLGFPARLELGVAMPQWLVALHVAFVVLCIVGLIDLLRRRQWLTLGIWALPIVITVLFNLAGKWPYGVFRTNVYLLFYAIGLVCCGLAALAPLVARTPLGRRAASAVAVVVVVSIFPFDLSHFRTKEESALALSSSVRTALEKVYAAEIGRPGGRRARLLLDGHACGIYTYYLRSHVETRERFSKLFDERFVVGCSTVLGSKWRDALKQAPPFSSKVKILKAKTTGPKAAPADLVDDDPADDDPADDDVDGDEPVFEVFVNRAVQQASGIQRGPFVFDWLITAKPSFIEITREELPATCSDSTEELLPASTLLVHCTRPIP